MVHRRSDKAQIRRENLRYLHTVSYRDPILCETISTVEVAVPVKVWNGENGYCWEFMVYDKGEVLTDSRGRGSLQK